MILTSLVLTSMGALGVQDGQPKDDWTVHAKKVYTSTGVVHENAVVVVTDGKITAVTPGVEAPRDALSVAVVTAGMVDAGARVNMGLESVEQSREVTPSVDARYGVDPFDTRWARLASSGVTTTFNRPLDQNCIGGLGVVLKTAGGPLLHERMLEGTPMMCGAIGSQPSQRNSPAFGRPDSFYNRRPTTRMGVEWEWRQAFFEAGQAPSEGAGAEVDLLQDVLAGKIGTFVQAWTTQDIRTAVYLKEEMMREGFGAMRIVIDCGAEAWKEPDMLVRTETAVVLPPFPDQGRTGDQALMPMDVAAQLRDAGIPFALSAHDGGDAQGRLAVQAGFAMRGGLTREEALRAVTLTPAELLGIEARVGSVEVGKDADLVLWNGEPFEITSKPVGVLVDGRLVVDPR